MSESQNENPPAKEGEHKTPTKRTPSKRMSIIERAQRESEELIKNMGGSLDVEGGRRTRSSARGASAPSTPSTPPPAKKARMTTTTPRRGRQKKNELLEVNNEEKIVEKEESPKKSDSGTVDDVTDNKKDQIKNCTENDVGADGKTGEKEKNSEPIEVEDDEDEEEAAAKKPNSGENLESITEVAEAQDEVTKPSSQSAEAPAEPMATSVPEGETADEDKPESVPEKKLESADPMEIDGSALDADEAKVKPANDSKDSLSADSAKIDNIDAAETAEVHENSIEKPTIEENKVDESKTGTDVCEPKISSPTSTGDVVAAQTCN